MRRRRRSAVTCAAAAAADAADAADFSRSSSVSQEEQQTSSSAAASSSSSSVSQADSRKIVFLCAVAMLLASADRTIFSLASMAIAEDLGLGMSSLGLLQSSFLW
jgi:hypothetical protein